MMIDNSTLNSTLNEADLYLLSKKQIQEHKQAFAISSIKNNKKQKPKTNKREPQVQGNKSPKKENKKTYKTTPDGACMFRAFFAYKYKEPAWLVAGLKSTDELKNLIEQEHKKDIKVSISHALQNTLKRRQDDFMANQSGEGPDYHAEHYFIKESLETLIHSDFRQQVYERSLAKGNFKLWDTNFILNLMFEYVPPQHIHPGFMPTFIQLANDLTNGIAELICDRLSIPIDPRQPVHLKREGLHYDLVAPVNFFSPEQIEQFTPFDLTLLTDDPFLSGLKNRWGEQKLGFGDDFEQETADKPRRDRRYKHFKKHVGGFDFEEEKNNSPDDPLISFQEGLNAGVSLYIDAIQANANFWGAREGVNFAPRAKKTKSYTDTFYDIAKSLKNFLSPEQASQTSKAKAAPLNFDDNLKVEYQDDEITIECEIPSRPRQAKTSLKKAEPNKENEGNKEKQKTKESWLQFPAANGMNPARALGQDKTQKYQNEYDDWAKDKSHLRRTKRRFDQSVTAEDMMTLNIEEIDTRIDPDELKHLQSLIAPDSDSSQENSNKFQEILKEIKRLDESNPYISNFFSDSLDAIQMAFVENSEEFRTANDFYWRKNIESMEAGKGFYFHKDIEDYFNPSKDQADKKTFQSASTYSTDMREKQLTILADIYSKSSSNEAIDYSKLGMAMAHTDIDILAVDANYERTLWDNFLQRWQEELDYDPKAKRLQESLAKRLAHANIDPSTANPEPLSQSLLVSRSTPHAKHNIGFCQYLSTSFLLDMQSRKTKTIEPVIHAVRKLKEHAVSNTKKNVALINTLNSLNDELQSTPVDYQRKPHLRVEADLESEPMYFNQLLWEIENSDTAKRISIKSLGAAEFGHSIAVGQILIPPDRKIYVLIDANYGVVHCYNSQQLKLALEQSLALFGDTNPNDIANAKSVFTTIDMTPENTHIIKRLKTYDGLKYGLLTNEAYEPYIKPHNIAVDEDLRTFLPGLSDEKIPNADTSSPSAYKQTGLDVPLEKLITLLDQGRYDQGGITEPTFSTDEISNKVKPDSAFLTNQQKLDKLVQQQDNIIQDPIRTNKVNPTAESQSGQEKIKVDIGDPESAAKVVKESPESIGKSLFEALKTENTDIKKAMTGIKISLDTSNNNKIKAEPIFTDKIKIEPNPLLTRMGLDTDLLADLITEKNTDAYSSKLTGLKEKVKTFLDKELSSISEDSLRKIEIDNQKTLQKIKALDYDAVNTKLKNKLTTASTPDKEIVNYLIKGVEETDNNKFILLENKNSKNIIKINIEGDSDLSDFYDIKRSISDRINDFDNVSKGAKSASALKTAWKGFGKVGDMAGKAMSIYGMVNLSDQLRSFGHSTQAEQVNIVATAIDVTLDTVANTVSTTNFLVKRVSGPVAALSASSRLLTKASSAVGILVNIGEVAYHSYNYHNAETDFERKLSGLYVGCAVVQTAVSAAAIAVCSAFPLAAPLFMLFAGLIMGIQYAIAQSMINQEVADDAFRPFAHEMEKLKKLFDDPKVAYSPDDNTLIISSKSVPYTKLIIAESGVSMTYKDQPFAFEFIKQIESTVDSYTKKIYEPPFSGNCSTVPNPLPNATQYTNFSREAEPSREVLIGASPTFIYGFNDTSSAINNTSVTSNSNSNSNSTKSYKNEKIQIDLYASLKSTSEKIKSSNSTLNSTIKNIVITGHPVKPTYLVNECTEATSSTEPTLSEELKKIKAANGTNSTSTKWEHTKNNIKVVKKFKSTKTKYPKKQNKFTFFEGKEFIAKDREKCNDNNSSIETLESITEDKNCWQIPDAARVEIQTPEYILNSKGKSSPLIYSFEEDKLANNLTQFARLNDTEQQLKLLNEHLATYGLNQSFPIIEHNVNDTIVPYDIKLADNGSYYFNLKSGTRLDIENQAPDNSDGNIIFFLDYLSILANGFFPETSTATNKKPAIVAKKINDTKTIEVCSDCGLKDQITVNMKGNVSQTPLINVNKFSSTYSTLAGKESFIFEPIFYNGTSSNNTSTNTTGELVLKKANNIPMTTVDQTSLGTHMDLQELNKTMPNIQKHNGFHIESFYLDSPYHRFLFNKENIEAKSFFKSSGWCFVKDGNENGDANNKIDSVLKGHKTFDKYGIAVIPKIWRSDLANGNDEEKKLDEIFTRMQFIGFTEVPFNNVLHYLQPGFKRDEPCYVYHFYDKETKTLVKQFGETEICWWDSTHVTKCPDSSTNEPEKILWGEDKHQSFSCDTIHMSDQRSSASVTSARIQMSLDTSALATEYKGLTQKKDTTNSQTEAKPSFKHLFDFISFKAKEKYKTYFGFSNEANKTNSSIPSLFIDMQNVKTENGNNSLSLILVNDNDLQLAVYPKEEELIAIPKGHSYSLSVARGNQTNSDLEFILKARKTLSGDELKTFSDKIINNATNPVLPDTLKPNEHTILPNITLTGIVNDPEKKLFNCRSSEDVIFSLSHDLDSTKLIAVNPESYYEKEQNTTNPLNPKTEYINLELTYGKPDFDYFKLAEGSYNETIGNATNKPTIFVNTETATPIYIPSHFKINGNATRVSKDTVVLAEQHFTVKNESLVLAQDVGNQVIFEVNNPHARNSTMANVLPYSYLAKTKDSVYLGVKQSNKDDSSDTKTKVQLPFVSTDHLALMPWKKGNQTQAKTVQIPPILQHRLKTITLVSPSNKKEQVQKIEVNTDNNQTKAQAVIQDYGNNQTELLIFMPTTGKLNDRTVETSPLVLRLDDPFENTNNNTLKPCFNNTVNLNGNPINLQELINNATKIDLSYMAKDKAAETNATASTSKP